MENRLTLQYLLWEPTMMPGDQLERDLFRNEFPVFWEVKATAVQGRGGEA